MVYKDSKSNFEAALATLVIDDLDQKVEITWFMAGFVQ